MRFAFCLFFWEGEGRRSCESNYCRKNHSVCADVAMLITHLCVCACVHASAACCQRQPADFDAVSQLLPQIVKVERRTRPQRISKISFISFSIATASPALRFQLHTARTGDRCPSCRRIAREPAETDSNPRSRSPRGNSELPIILT